MALQVVALCCLALADALLVVTSVGTGSSVARAVVLAIMVPLIGGLWFLRPRLVRDGHGVAVTALGVLLATPIAVLGDLRLTLPVLLLIVALAIVDVSLRAGVHAMIWICLTAFVLLVCTDFHTGDSLLVSLGQAFIDPLLAAVVLSFGIVLGLALRGFEERREGDRRIIDRLRYTSEIEKELLLADERARSARELHDGLGYRLTLVLMSLELAERMRARDADQAWTEIHTARETAGEALSEMRTWVRALNPVRDASARGLAALELIAESFRGTGLVVSVTGDDAADRELLRDDDLALLVYRVVQEGLTNALRHGQARHVHIEIASVERWLRVAVTNDLGRGAVDRVPEGEPEPGFGLRGLSERVEGRGGRLRAHRLGNRFELTLAVPLDALIPAGGRPDHDWSSGHD